MDNSTLTIEEQLEQLKGELEKLRTEKAELEDTNNRLKVSTSKANSEAADFKRKWQQTLSDAEKAEEARKEAESATKAQLEELLREKKTAKLKADLIGTGFNKDEAESAAAALVEGDSDKVVETLSSFLQGFRKRAVAEVLGSTPKPDTKGDPNYRAEVTREQFKKMGYTELVELKNKNPELYEKLSS